MLKECFCIIAEAINRQTLEQIKMVAALHGVLNDIFCAIDSQRGKNMEPANVVQSSGEVAGGKPVEEKAEAVTAEKKPEPLDVPTCIATEREKEKQVQREKDLVQGKIIGLSQRIDMQAETILGLIAQVSFQQRQNEIQDTQILSLQKQIDGLEEQDTTLLRQIEIIQAKLET